MEKIIYVVKRYEDDDSSFKVFDEKAFLSSLDAKQYADSLDPSGNGFEYTCPCGCGDAHWRSWEVESLVLNLPDLPKQEKLDSKFAQVIEDKFWELVVK